MNIWSLTPKAGIESVTVRRSVHVTNISTEVVSLQTSAAGVSDSETEGAKMWDPYSYFILYIILLQAGMSMLTGLRCEHRRLWA
jgi:hypothetical protein